MLITECGEPIDHPGYQAQRESTDEEDDGNCDEPEREPTKSMEQHHNRVHCPEYAKRDGGFPQARRARAMRDGR
jgi:hypothetical protein